mgnify:CR=1 FL=1
MKKQLSALLAAALCAGALAGCGANSNSANAATSGAEDTVTLAVVSPVTGDSADARARPDGRGADPRQAHRHRR